MKRVSLPVVTFVITVYDRNSERQKLRYLKLDGVRVSIVTHFPINWCQSIGSNSCLQYAEHAWLSV